MTREHIYVDIEGQTEGPYSLQEVLALLEAGTISEFTPYAAEGMDEWRQVSELVRPSQKPKDTGRCLKSSRVVLWVTLIGLGVAALGIGMLAVARGHHESAREQSPGAVAPSNSEQWSEEDRQRGRIVRGLQPHYPSSNKEELVELARSITGIDPLVEPGLVSSRMDSIMSAARATGWDERKALELAARATQSGASHLGSVQLSGAATPYIMRIVMLGRYVSLKEAERAEAWGLALPQLTQDQMFNQAQNGIVSIFNEDAFRGAMLALGSRTLTSQEATAIHAAWEGYARARTDKERSELQAPLDSAVEEALGITASVYGRQNRQISRIDFIILEKAGHLAVSMYQGRKFMVYQGQLRNIRLADRLGVDQSVLDAVASNLVGGLGGKISDEVLTALQAVRMETVTSTLSKNAEYLDQDTTPELLASQLRELDAAARTKGLSGFQAVYRRDITSALSAAGTPVLGDNTSRWDREQMARKELRDYERAF